MDNEFTKRLEREGLRSISKFLQAILKSLDDIKNEVQELKRKTSTNGGTTKKDSE
jgi:hypothetical protein